MMRVRPSVELEVLADLAVDFLAADDDFLAVGDFEAFVDLALDFFTVDEDFFAALVFLVASSIIGEAVSNTGEMLTTPIMYFFNGLFYITKSELLLRYVDDNLSAMNFTFFIL